MIYRVLYTGILIVYMGAMYMYVDGQCTCILMVYKGAKYMFIDCV